MKSLQLINCLYRQERKMSIKELVVVKLNKEFNELSAGTKGTIVLEHDGTSFEVEFVDDGDTIDVITIPAELLELVIPC